jgi:DNA-binding NarL/FixJ family response regulator
MNKTIPQLSGKDFHLCCLVKAGFTNEDIAIVLNKTPNAIQLEKSYIRQKLGFGKQVSFIRQLDELVLGAS